MEKLLNYINSQLNNTNTTTLTNMVTSIKQNIPNIYVEELSPLLYIIVNKNDGNQLILHQEDDGSLSLSCVKTNYSKKLKHYVGSYETTFIPTIAHLMDCLISYQVIPSHPDWE